MIYIEEKSSSRLDVMVNAVYAEGVTFKLEEVRLLFSKVPQVV
jgi:hypothetical protein